MRRPDTDPNWLLHTEDGVKHCDSPLGEKISEAPIHLMDTHYKLGDSLVLRLSNHPNGEVHCDLYSADGRVFYSGLTKAVNEFNIQSEPRKKEIVLASKIALAAGWEPYGIPLELREKRKRILEEILNAG